MKTFVIVYCVFLFVKLLECSPFELKLDAENHVVWRLENGNGSISVDASVPGGVYTDLMRAGIINDTLYRFNDVQTRWVAYEQWTYTAQFDVPEEYLRTAAAQLVFYGVDTIAYVDLNDSPIGSMENMFVRYVFDVKLQLKAINNTLKINFASPVVSAQIRSETHFTAPNCVPDVYNGECHANQLRKMQASFAWDWGPAFPSVGLWKPVTLEFFNKVIMRAATIHTSKVNDEWKIKIVAYLESNQYRQQIDVVMDLMLIIDKYNQVTETYERRVSTTSDGTAEVAVEMKVNEKLIKLWWPNGYGDHPTYDLHILCAPKGEEDQQSYLKYKIGFRTLELVEEDAANKLGNTTEAEGLTFYFKVNGYPLFMKGSNWIPANILPELGQDGDIVDNLLQAAHDTNMAMLRVWGGGVYESDYFYQRCDELGILIWQDFMFACSMYPADVEFLDNVKAEVYQTVIRLQHHPSIAVWAGNNENEVALRGDWYGTRANYEKYKAEYIKLYVDTIKPIVESLDPGRRYLVSSPSNGRKSEEDGYIADNPYDSHYGDTHYYNYVSDNWDINIYPPTRFASEYGFQSLPSLETMASATNDVADFSLNSDYSKHRQHSPNGYGFIQIQMDKYLKIDEKEDYYFQKFVFYSQISQAMSIKAETEFYRQSQTDWYTMGALYWQLNDVWQAPSWSGIEYGGKWKMLHYFAKSFFAPVLVSPRFLKYNTVEVYLLNDRFDPIDNAEIIVDYFNWTNILPYKTISFKASAKALSSTKQDISIDLKNENTKTIFLRFSLKAGKVKSPCNFVFPKPFKNVVGLQQPLVTISVSRLTAEGDKLWNYDVKITVDRVVLFFWLETSLAGHFEENGFIITDRNVHVKFIAKNNYEPKNLEHSITYKYYIN